MMENAEIGEVIRILEKFTKKYNLPVAELLEKWKDDPFKILVTIVLSSRTKDEVTADAAKRLFSKMHFIGDIKKIPPEKIEGLIFPVGFYKTKARRIREMVVVLDKNFGGQVPETIEELTTIPGVGRKTANLVVYAAFKRPGVCVDTHVHRILNRLGYISTKTPHETEMELRQKLPKKYWAMTNATLVMFGRSICTPVSPFCSKCPVAKFCEKVGVLRSR
ncbi:MAG: endonuclease III domain-containing protein [Candidatus Aenigmatarchaeota archaeon]